MAGGSSFFKKKEEPSKFGLAPIFKYEELKKATNNFSTEIGDGGFGRVYHGKLRDGREVAVKELFERNPNRLEQFLNEVTVFSRLQHENLINLYGCTNPRDQKLFLVYDYVPNGTVEEHLHGHRSFLTLSLRIQIAVETAEVLSYLHALKPLIIHRDVKTANILLDNAFHVKVADLGICRPFPFGAVEVSTLPQGTVGYRDPEYDECLRLTDKSDVYSFGVVLMELVSGQKAVDIYRDPIYLYHLVLNKKPEEIVDPELGDHSNGDVKSIIDSVAQLASECLQTTGNTRPPMLQVLSVLKDIQIKMLDVMSIAPQPDQGALAPAFKVYGLAVLRAATKGFSAKMVVSESGEPNVVYRGNLDDNRLVEVKRFSKNLWPDANQFVAEASGVGSVRHKQMVNLIGCCAEGDERLLVAEFMPNDTLAKHLFHCQRTEVSCLYIEPILGTHISSEPSTQLKRHFTGKQKIVVRVSMEDAKHRSKALKITMGMPGIISATLEGEKIVVVGDGFDPVKLVVTLKKKLGFAELVSVGAAEEKKQEAKKPEEEKEEKKADEAKSL